jgi:hypothetical protein
MSRTLIALASLAFCSVAGVASADAIHDNYRYTSSTSINLTSPTALTLQDTSNGTLTATNHGQDVKFVFTSDGNVCKLGGRLSGHSIRFYANQSCSFGDTTMRLTASVTAGQAVVGDDGSLELEIVWSLTGTMQGHKVSGTASERTSATPLYADAP